MPFRSKPCLHAHSPPAANPQNPSSTVVVPGETTAEVVLKPYVAGRWSAVVHCSHQVRRLVAGSRDISGPSPGLQQYLTDTFVQTIDIIPTNYEGTSVASYACSSCPGGPIMAVPMAVAVCMDLPSSSPCTKVQRYFGRILVLDAARSHGLGELFHPASNLFHAVADTGGQFLRVVF
jgi:hypothetical protein